MTTGHAILFGMFISVGVEAALYVAYRLLRKGGSTFYNKLVADLKKDLDAVTPPAQVL